MHQLQQLMLHRLHEPHRLHEQHIRDTNGHLRQFDWTHFSFSRRFLVVVFFISSSNCRRVDFSPL
jgi:hypothetical protein